MTEVSDSNHMAHSYKFSLKNDRPKIVPKCVVIVYRLVRCRRNYLFRVRTNRIPIVNLSIDIRVEFRIGIESISGVVLETAYSLRGDIQRV